MKEKEIRALVDFAYWSTKDPDFCKVKEMVERFITFRPDHLGNWIAEGRDADEYVIPERQILLKVLREKEIRRIKGEIECYQGSLELLEDDYEFNDWVAFIEYKEEEIENE